MRKNIRDNLIEVISTILDAHEVALKYAKSGEIDLVMSVFTECQDAMVKIGEVIEANEGENHKTIEFLQSYCDELYEVSLVIAENNEPNFNKLFKKIALKLKDVHYSIKNDIKIKLEVVFLPYKASMWDSLESVWKAAEEDPDCDAYVIPIPYYDRKSDFSFGEMHYEGNIFPDYVPITHYDDYNIELRRPDAIYIHNPYDEFNYVTSVDPRFYSSVLKDCTDCLVYIPYFVMKELNPNNPNVINKMKDYVLKPAVANAHKVIVQSEAMRELYLKTIFDEYGDTPEVRSFFENRILGVGSPKFDKVINSKKEDFKIPDEWKSLIGSRKIILYNTSVTSILRGESAYIEKLKDVLNYFKTQNDVVLWWRPHPLSATAYDSMRHSLLDEYLSLVEDYKNAGYGIYDDTPDLNRALACSDAYYGDWSSLVVLYQITGKPIFIQSLNVRTDDEFFDLTFEAMYDDGEYLWFTPIYFNALMKMNKETEEITLVGFFPEEDVLGVRLFSDIQECGNKLYFAPLSAKAIAVYDLETGEFSRVHFDETFCENSNLKFYSIAVYNDVLYFFPYWYSAVLVYNTSLNSVIYLTGWVNPIKQSKYYKKEYGYFRKFEVVDRKVYLPCICTNVIVVFDLDLQKFQMINLGDYDISFHSICYNKDNLWVSGYKKNIIVSLNLKTNATDFIELKYIEDKLQNNAFRDICTVGDKVILFPYASKEVVSIDVITKNIEVLENRGEPKQRGWLVAHFINATNSGEKVYAIDVQKGSLNVYSDDFTKLASIDLRMSTEIKDMLNRRKITLLEDICNYTEGIFNLTDIVNYCCNKSDVKNCNNAVKYRSEIRKKTLPNPDSTSGVSIYRYIKNLNCKK